MSMPRSRPLPPHAATRPQQGKPPFGTLLHPRSVLGSLADPTTAAVWHLPWTSPTSPSGAQGTTAATGRQVDQHLSHHESALPPSTRYAAPLGARAWWGVPCPSSAPVWPSAPRLDRRHPKTCAAPYKRPSAQWRQQLNHTSLDVVQVPHSTAVSVPVPGVVARQPLPQPQPQPAPVQGHGCEPATRRSTLPANANKRAGETYHTQLYSQAPLASLPCRVMGRGIARPPHPTPAG